MRIPDFIVVGAHKAGTTSLYHYLAQHPDLALIPNKGSDLLARRKFTTLNEAGEYLAQFEGVGETKILGEVSSVYLHRDGVAQRIKNLFPNVKIIAVLRDPVERAYSHAHWDRAYTLEELRHFDRIVLNSEIFLNPGLYGKHLTTYFSLFKKDQIKLMLFDDLKKGENQFCQELYQFIGVESNFVPKTEEKYHVGALKLNNTSSQLLKKGFAVNRNLKNLVPKSVRSWVIKALESRSSAPKMELSTEFKAKLRNYYYEDLIVLQKLTGLNCSHWLKD